MKLLGITADCFFGVQAQAGTALKIRSNTSAFGFNGQLKDNEIAGVGNHIDFKFRDYDPRLARFTSVDPLTAQYPWNSTYAFAENRPIDGIDLEGREWSWSVVNGRLQVSVNTQLQVSNDLTAAQVAAYKQGISTVFNKMIQASTGGFVTGKVTYNGKTAASGDRLVPTIAIDAKKYSPNAKNGIVVSGQEWPGYVGINVYNKRNELRSPEDFGETAAHELVHTLKIDHPFATTQTGDDELINVGDNEFQTTPNTNPNIQYNIMNYGYIKINGVKLSDLWKTKRPLLLTPGQLKLGLKEIMNQMRGEGGGGYGNTLHYYMKEIGTPVKEKKKKP